MASTTFNGPVRSEKGFQVATKNSSTGAVTTRMSSGMPDLTGLSICRCSNCIYIDCCSRYNFMLPANYANSDSAVAGTLPARQRKVL